MWLIKRKQALQPSSDDSVIKLQANVPIPAAQLTENNHAEEDAASPSCAQGAVPNQSMTAFMASPVSTSSPKRRFSIRKDTALSAENNPISDSEFDELVKMLPNHMPKTAMPLLGDWKNTQVSKEYEGYLKDLGIPWLIRKPALMFRPVVSFYVKSFSEDEIKNFDRYLSHVDGNPVIGCSFNIGPQKVAEPMVGFSAPARLGPKIKESITRKFDGDDLVTMRDWTVLQNARSSFKPLPTEIRCSVQKSSLEGVGDVMVETIIWAEGKKCIRTFVRSQPQNLKDCIRKGIPDRPIGCYFIWTQEGVNSIQKKLGLKKQQLINQMIFVDQPFTQIHFNNIYSHTIDEDMKEGQVKDVYDWDRLLSLKYIAEAPIIPPELPSDPQYSIRQDLVDYLAGRAREAGQKEVNQGGSKFCPFCKRNQIEAGALLTKDKFMLIFVGDPTHIQSIEHMVELNYVEEEDVDKAAASVSA